MQPAVLAAVVPQSNPFAGPTATAVPILTTENEETVTQNTTTTGGSNAGIAGCGADSYAVVFTGGPFYFAWSGPVSGTGHFPDDDPSRCVTGVAATSAPMNPGMEVGAQSATGGYVLTASLSLSLSRKEPLADLFALSTKFEINVFSDGTLNVLDVSVCDGYSLSMNCTVAAPTVTNSLLYAGGGDITGTCPTGVQNGACSNTLSHSGTKDGPDPTNSYFHVDNYWYWDFNSKQVNWFGGTTITCAVGNTPATKAKRELDREEEGVLEAREYVEDVQVEAREALEAVARPHSHKGRAHARAMERS